MTEKIAFELRLQGKVIGCVTVKLCYSNFETFTTQVTIPYSNAHHVLFKNGQRTYYKTLRMQDNNPHDWYWLYQSYSR